MKKYILGAVMSLGILLSPALALAQSNGLTSDQVNAIISLLQSFSADQSVIDNTRIALNAGTTVPGAQTFCHTFTTDLTFGSSGPEVSSLSDALSLDSNMELGGTDVFTEDTAAAVVQFQSKYGITATGYVGSLTRAKLNSLYECNNGQTQTTTTVTFSGGEYKSPTFFPDTGGGAQFGYVWNTDLHVGSPYKNDIESLQIALTKEGVYKGPITGGFYTQTLAGVIAFQQKYGIGEAGNVGPLTRAKLNSLYSK